MLRHRLHFGPYRTPYFRIGQRVEDPRRLASIRRNSCFAALATASHCRRGWHGAALACWSRHSCQDRVRKAVR